jgi:suppressor of G2 allele of SKP1
MSSQAALGQTASKNGDYNAAITHLSAALQTSESPLWLIQRAVAYQRTNQHEKALVDAEKAVLGALKRGKRDMIADAQFRRALALQSLKRYGDARRCLVWANEKNDKLKGLTIWVGKIKADWEKAKVEEGEESEKCKVTVKEYPDAAADVSIKRDDTPAKVEVQLVEEDSPKVTSTALPTVTASTLQSTPKEKIRHEWYQSSQTVTISILAKGVSKDKAQIVIEEGSVS